jgi:hypothetical protein
MQPSSAASSLTFTIDSNTNVPYPIGTLLSFVNRAAVNLIITINSDTMYLANSITTGTRTLAQNGIAVALKVQNTVWIINGPGLT